MQAAEEKVTFDEAKTLCEGKNMQLPVPTTSEENEHRVAKTKIKISNIFKNFLEFSKVFKHFLGFPRIFYSGFPKVVARKGLKNAKFPKVVAFSAQLLLETHYRIFYNF